MMCGCWGCISWQPLSHITAYCCRLCKQMLGHQWQPADHAVRIYRYHCEQYVTWAPVVLSTGSNLRPLQSRNIHNKHVTNSLRRAVPSGQETGCWWKRKCDGKHIRSGEGAGEKGRDGMPRRMKERGVKFLQHLERIAHTSCRSTLGTCTLPSTLSHVLPCPAQPFHSEKCVTWIPDRTANKVCKQCHLVGTQLSTIAGNESENWLGFTLLT